MAKLQRSVSAYIERESRRETEKQTQRQIQRGKYNSDSEQEDIEKEKEKEKEEEEEGDGSQSPWIVTPLLQKEPTEKGIEPYQDHRDVGKLGGEIGLRRRTSRRNAGQSPSSSSSPTTSTVQSFPLAPLKLPYPTITTAAAAAAAHSKKNDSKTKKESKTIAVTDADIDTDTGRGRGRRKGSGGSTSLSLTATTTSEGEWYKGAHTHKNIDTDMHVKREENVNTMTIPTTPTSAQSTLSLSLSLSIHDIQKIIILPKAEADRADEALDHIFVKYARQYPLQYINYIGKVLVMTELFALLTPCVAVGIQWITALCKKPPVYVMIDLITQFFSCCWHSLNDKNLQWTCDLTQHCIMRAA